MKPKFKIPGNRVSDNFPAMLSIFFVLELWLRVNAVSDEIVRCDFVSVYQREDLRRFCLHVLIGFRLVGRAGDYFESDVYYVRRCLILGTSNDVDVRLV